MRLRLTVQRNGNGHRLPAANIVWSVPDTNSSTAYTIARLLDDVNHIIPLEVEHCGLEHYVVEVGGFECLHFTPVSQALKEDDHVSIRPLMTAEVRARTLAGRHQISDDGRHLVDGVPFGRPYLRHSNRPPITLPPRKRPRLEHFAADEPTEMALLLDAKGEDPGPISSANTCVSRRSKKSALPKAVHFNQVEVDQLDNDWDDDEEDDQDFHPEGYSEKDDKSNSESEKDSRVSCRLSDSTESDTEFGSSSDSSAESEPGSGSDSSTDSDSDSGSNASSPPEVLSSNDDLTKQSGKAKASTPPKHVPPGHGRNVTRSRNARRVRANRLRHLKASFKLPQDANLSDLQKYEEALTVSNDEMKASSRPFTVLLGKRKRFDIDNSEIVATEEDELARKKQELMARFTDQTLIRATQVDEPRVSRLPSAKSDEAAIGNVSIEGDALKEVAAVKRLRPDTTAIRRILVRQAVPTTKKAKIKPVVKESQEDEGIQDPDFWKSRLSLSAFECWEEDFELIAPPFPFEQHWDPASKSMRDKANKKKEKKGGNVSNRELVRDDEDEPVALDYDDTPITRRIPVSDDDATTAIVEPLQQHVTTTAQADLPPMPEDVSILSELVPSDIKRGAAIICKFLTVNPATVTPEISEAKISIVTQEGDSGNGAGTIRLHVQDGDVPAKERGCSSEGNGILRSKDEFFVKDNEGDGGGEDIWEGMFSELLEAKLLQAA